GTGGERACDLQALQLADTQHACLRLSSVRELGPGEHLVHPLACLRSPEPEATVEHADPDVVRHGHVPERLDDLVRPDQPPGDDLVVAKPGQLLVPEPDAARGGMNRAHQTGEESCLSSAVGTDDAEDLPWLNLEGDGVEREKAAEALAHRGHHEDGSALSRHCAPRQSPEFAAGAASPGAAPR